MDRNYKLYGIMPWKIVALRKESVDRNFCASVYFDPILGSLSARRAWIEIVRGFALPYKLYCRSPQGERG